ncbi:hypothetical protein like AT5G38020 [Hibiscus trionum]|uniref:Uncharacterized protein n=1 Tax=Hibiscus trionum TaxID=183268 RepID=A0A9W7HTV7_HIBTR|nr:hypothetical protein like AT5G38020 [Hibiscus trionum]
MLSKILPVTCIKVADLGCASGPNAFSPTNEIMDTIIRVCQQSHKKLPEIQVFLNDPPDNDFNDVFRSVPAFNSKLSEDKGDLRGPCFVAGAPGSFYERFFPSKSIHFVHSSYCLHWLSKVPKGVENNKGNIYISKSSPPQRLFGAISKRFLEFSTISFRRNDKRRANAAYLHR